MAKLICSLVPSVQKVRMTNSGTESVEAAIKLAKYHTGRSRFIGFHGGFHGRTLGALAFTASKSVQRNGFFPVMPGVTHSPFPDPYRPILIHNGRDYGEVAQGASLTGASARPAEG